MAPAAALPPPPQDQHPAQMRQPHHARHRQQPQPPQVQRARRRLGLLGGLTGRRRLRGIGRGLGQVVRLRLVRGIRRIRRSLLRLGFRRLVGLVGYIRLHGLRRGRVRRGRRRVQGHPAPSGVIILHPGVGAVLSDGIPGIRRAGDGVARHVPGRDIQRPQQERRGRGEVDAVAPAALRQEIEGEVLPLGDSGRIHIVGTPPPHPVGHGLGAGAVGQSVGFQQLQKLRPQFFRQLQVLGLNVVAIGVLHCGAGQRPGAVGHLVGLG